MTGWIIFGAIVLFFALIFALPIGLDLHYQTAISGAVKLAGIPIVRFPSQNVKKAKPKKEKPKKEKKAKKTDEKPPKENLINQLYQQDGVGGILDFLGGVTRILGELTSRIGRKFLLKRCDIHVVVGGTDTACAAVAYGKISTAFYGAMGALLSLVRYKKYRADVSVDFFRKTTDAQARIEVQITVGAIVVAVLRAGISFLKLLIKMKRKEVAKCPKKMHKV